MTAPAPHGNERGFSLIELLVAMVITLIVSGAIYGLLAGGQNAFRREPELTERQQNIRLAMDLVMRDISNAGAGLPPFVQVFRPGLDACPTATCPGNGQPGPTGAMRDEIAMLSSTGRDTEPACFVASTANSGLPGLSMVRQGQVIPENTVVALLMDNGTWSMRKLSADSVPDSTATLLGACTGTHTLLTMATGDDAPSMNQPELCVPSIANPPELPALGNSVAGCVVTGVAFPRLVHYRIRNDPAGVPTLERFSTDNLGGFQTVARGIEDLQVQYTVMADETVWADNAPPVPAPAAPPIPVGDWAALTQQVQVTLTARSEAQNIQGAMTDAAGETRIRGSLTSRGTPRAVLMHIAAAHPSPMPPSPAAWYWE